MTVKFAQQIICNRGAFASQVLVQAPRVLFLLVLILVPWPYGSAHPSTEDIFTIILLGIFAAECVVLMVSSKRRTETRAAAMPLALAGLILVYGIFLAWNSRWTFVSETSRFVPIEPMLIAGPGWIDLGICLRKVSITFGALVALYFGVTLGTDPRWRRLLWGAIVVSGVAIALFGIAQSVTKAPAIFWTAGKRSTHFFGPFVYHANAGAFLNLSLPLVLTHALFVLRKPKNAAAKFVWSPLALVLFACTTITGSKGAMLISTSICLVTLVWWIGRRLKRCDVHTGTLIVGVFIAVLGVGALSVALGWERTLDRWSHFLAGEGEYAADRRLVYETCVNIIQNEWFTGFGAGTFGHVFPHFTHHLGNRIEGVWLYAHQDYLQTIIEWGWPGACLWAGIYFGGLIEGIRALLHQKKSFAYSRTHEILGLILALSGILVHALFDYPLQVYSLLIFTLAISGMLWSSSSWADQASRRRTVRCENDG